MPRYAPSFCVVRSWSPHSLDDCHSGGVVGTKQIFIVAAVASLASTGALAQSAGSGGGSFSNAFLIPAIVCSVTANATTASSCSNQVGSAKVLYGNIKVPSASNKNVVLMGSLETSILTNTTVASSNGTKSTSSAFGSIIVTPQIY